MFVTAGLVVMTLTFFVGGVLVGWSMKEYFDCTRG